MKSRRISDFQILVQSHPAKIQQDLITKTPCNIVLKRYFEIAGAITDSLCPIFKVLDAMRRQGMAPAF